MNRDIIESYKELITEKTKAQMIKDFLSFGWNYTKKNPGRVAGAAAVAGAAGYYGYDSLFGGSPNDSIQQEKTLKKSETKAMQTRLKQEMANIRSAGDTDEVAIRKKAIENLGKDEDFVAQANEMGYTVGKVGGSDNAMFGYRHSTGAEAKKASDASKAQLFDAQGRAKVFERDPSTGQMVGRSPTEAEVAARKQPVNLPGESNTSKTQFSVGRGSRGQTVITGGSYINPNSPEGRMQAQIDAKTAPDIWTRDSSGKISQGQGVRGGKLPMDVEAQNRAAGKAAFNKSIEGSLGFNPDGMSTQEIMDTAAKNERVKRATDYNTEKQKDMEANPVGWEQDKLSNPITYDEVQSMKGKLESGEDLSTTDKNRLKNYGKEMSSNPSMSFQGRFGLKIPNLQQAIDQVIKKQRIAPTITPTITPTQTAPTPVDIPPDIEAARRYDARARLTQRLKASAERGEQSDWSSAYDTGLGPFKYGGKPIPNQSSIPPSVTPTQTAPTPVDIPPDIEAARRYDARARLTQRLKAK